MEAGTCPVKVTDPWPREHNLYCWLQCSINPFVNFFNTFVKYQEPGRKFILNRRKEQTGLSSSSGYFHDKIFHWTRFNHSISSQWYCDFLQTWFGGIKYNPSHLVRLMSKLHHAKGNITKNVVYACALMCAHWYTQHKGGKGNYFPEVRPSKSPIPLALTPYLDKLIDQKYV